MFQIHILSNFCVFQNIERTRASQKSWKSLIQQPFNLNIRTMFLNFTAMLLEENITAIFQKILVTYENRTAMFQNIERTRVSQKSWKRSGSGRQLRQWWEVGMNASVNLYQHAMFTIIINVGIIVNVQHHDQKIYSTSVFIIFIILIKRKRQRRKIRPTFCFRKNVMIFIILILITSMIIMILIMGCIMSMKKQGTLLKVSKDSKAGRGKCCPL